MTRALARSAALVAGVGIPAASAHTPAGQDPGALWNVDPLVLVPLLMVAVLYAAGIVRLWRRAGRGRGVPVWRAVACATGLGALFLALVSPLDSAAEASFALHMAQHMLLMVVAAPLIALGTTGVVLLAALPADWRVPFGRSFASRPLRRARALLLTVPGATALHGAVIWLWHAPGLYEAALAEPSLHYLEHFTMFGSAAVFWWSVVSAGRRRPLGHGAGIAALFLTMLHTGVLGILITLAPAPVYADDAMLASPLGFSSLEDQQLAGITMLLTGGIAYLGAGLALLSIWLAQAERSAV